MQESGGPVSKIPELISLTNVPTERTGRTSTTFDSERSLPASLVESTSMPRGQATSSALTLQVSEYVVLRNSLDRGGDGVRSRARLKSAAMARASGPRSPVVSCGGSIGETGWHSGESRNFSYRPARCEVSTRDSFPAPPARCRVTADCRTTAGHCYSTENGLWRALVVQSMPPHKTGQCRSQSVQSGFLTGTRSWCLLRNSPLSTVGTHSREIGQSASESIPPRSGCRRR